jgi:3-hydroxyacyl-[acyl-carrier-protein] dehydratase
LSWEIPEEVRTVLRAAEKARLAPAAGGPPLLDRAGIEALVPHRGDALLLDRVTAIDPLGATIVARYDLGRDAAALAGHFPGQPVWPGVLQVEAIGQAGLVFLLATAPPGAAASEVRLTEILGARLMRAVRPPAEVEVVARVMEDGLFRIVVGQCLVGGQICSVAALSGC